jgi:protein-disulfide isomerase
VSHWFGFNLNQTGGYTLKNLRLSTLHKAMVGLLAAGFLFSGCAPSSKQLKDAVEKDPSIVFVAIEKDPEKFIEVVNAAARKAQQGQAEKQAKDEEGKRDDEFKNPLKPVIEDGRASEGPVNAPITLVEYSDFECPFCSRGYQTVQEVLKDYPGKIRFIYKHLPLDFHPKAMPAARYFEAIVRQSPEKAYKWHNAIFENQAELRAKGDAFMAATAKKVGADVNRINKDLKDPTLMNRINADMEEAKKFGFNGTPGFVINGVSLRGAYPASEFKKIIDRELGGEAGAAKDNGKGAATPAPEGQKAAQAPAAEGAAKTE